MWVLRACSHRLVGANRAVLPAPACGVTPEGEGCRGPQGQPPGQWQNARSFLHSRDPQETRQMTEKRFTIWPVLFPIKARTFVNMQGWDSGRDNFISKTSGATQAQSLTSFLAPGASPLKLFLLQRSCFCASPSSLLGARCLRNRDRRWVCSVCLKSLPRAREAAPPLCAFIEHAAWRCLFRGEQNRHDLYSGQRIK